MKQREQANYEFLTEPEPVSVKNAIIYAESVIERHYGKGQTDTRKNP